jgi:hypothetical protein
LKVGNQNAGVINNVEGIQNVNASQYGIYGHLPKDVQRALRDLSTTLNDVQLSARARAQAESDVQQIQAEMAKPDPNRHRVAEHPTGLAKILKSVGAVGTAISGLMGSVKTLAGWLGHAAAH